MAELLTLKVGDIIGSVGIGTNYYEISAWPEDPDDDHIRVRELRSTGIADTHALSYNKSALRTRNWRLISTKDERLIRSVGRHLALLGKDIIPEIHELLFKLEI